MSRFIDVEDAYRCGIIALDDLEYGESYRDASYCLHVNLEHCSEPEGEVTPAGVISKEGLIDWSGKTSTKDLCLVKLTNGGYKISYYNNIKYIENASEYWIIEEDL